MAGEYKSIADGMVLAATLVFWNVALDWLAFRSRAIRRFIEPPSLPLIRDGKWVRRNLKHQWITTEEVLSKLREHGIEHIAQVRIARLEPDGEHPQGRAGSGVRKLLQRPEGLVRTGPVDVEFGDAGGVETTHRGAATPCSGDRSALRSMRDMLPF